MNMTLLLSIIGFVLLNIAIVHYFKKLQKNETPKNPIFLKLGMAVGSLLSIWSVAGLFNQSESIGVIITVVVIALIVVPTSALFAYFLATKATPIGDIKVKESDAIIPFSNNEFDSGSLKGKRTLLKFYRGSWCPYCSAELVMFEDLKSKLNDYDIQIVAISNDTVQEQAVHQKRDGITHTLVSDSDLKIIRQYGVEHHKGLGGSGKGLISVMGITMPIPWTMRFKAMAIPTSILIDEKGKIVWIDQSEDYRLRASEEAVMGAVTAHFSKK